MNLPAKWRDWKRREKKKKKEAWKRVGMGEEVGEGEGELNLMEKRV